MTIIKASPTKLRISEVRLIDGPGGIGHRAEVEATEPYEDTLYRYSVPLDPHSGPPPTVGQPLYVFVSTEPYTVEVELKVDENSWRCAYAEEGWRCSLTIGHIGGHLHPEVGRE